jgi:hypothetical protein
MHTSTIHSLDAYPKNIDQKTNLKTEGIECFYECLQVWEKLEGNHAPHHQLLEYDEHDEVAEKAEEVHKHTHAHIGRERRTHIHTQNCGLMQFCSIKFAVASLNV